MGAIDGFLTACSSASSITTIAVSSALTVILAMGAMWSYVATVNRYRERLRIEEEWHHPTDCFEPIVKRLSSTLGRTTHELRTQRLELQTFTPNRQWLAVGFFRTVITVRKAAPLVNGTYYRIVGDDEVKESVAGDWGCGVNRSILACARRFRGNAR